MKKVLVAIGSAAMAAVLWAAAPATNKAESVKFASIKIADVTTTTNAIVQVAQHCSPGMEGMMFAMSMVQAFLQNDYTRELGPMRLGANVLSLFYATKEALTSEETMEEADVVVLYPTAWTKAKFLAAHTNAVEKNGVIQYSFKGGKTMDAVFSADGKWVATSDAPGAALRGIKEIAAAEKSMGGDVLQMEASHLDGLRFSPVMPVVNEKAETQDEVMELLRQIECGRIAFRVTAKGLEVHGAITPKAGTEIAKIGKIALDGDGKGAALFSKADARAVCAFAAAKNAGGRHGMQGKDAIEIFKKAFKAAGVDFVSVTYSEKEKNNGYKTYEVDVGKLTKEVYALTQSNALTNLFAELDKAADKEEKKFTAESPEVRGQSILKGVKPMTTVRQKYAAVMGDVEKKPIHTAWVGSIYDTLKVSLPLVMEAVGPTNETVQAMKPMVDMLPAVEDAATAMVCWNEGKELVYLMRFSKGELYGVCSAFKMAAMMSQAGCAAGDEDDEEEEEDDEEDL